jgi:hypothetical protein
MLYLVQARAAMERANTIDAGEGPVERFRPEAVYGQCDAARAIHGGESRHTGADGRINVCHHVVRRRGAHSRPEVFGEAIANAKRIICPAEIRRSFCKCGTLTPPNSQATGTFLIWRN